MALSTYFNWDTTLQTPISEICTNNNSLFRQPTPELAQDCYYYGNNHFFPCSDESFLLPNTVLDPYYCDQNVFLYPEIYPSEDQLLNFTPSCYDPFISLNDIYQTEKGCCNNNTTTLLPCPKRQKKCFHDKQELVLEQSPIMQELAPSPNSFIDGFLVPNPCSFPSPEELLPEELFSAVPDFAVPQFPQGTSCVAGNGGDSDVQGEKKGNSERTISAQSIAARERRRKITEKTQELGKLVPGGPKMNTAEMLHAASKYVKYLQAQVGMLELMNTLKEEDNAAPSSEDLQALVASPFVQEKMYSEEMCFVPKEFVTTLTNHGDVLSRPTILKDLKQLIGTDIEKKKAKQD